MAIPEEVFAADWSDSDNNCFWYHFLLCGPGNGSKRLDPMLHLSVKQSLKCHMEKNELTNY